MAIEVTRPGAPLYPPAQAGAPEVTTTIDPDVKRPGTIYYIPTTDVQEDNTIGFVIIYSEPAYVRTGS